MRVDVLVATSFTIRTDKASAHPTAASQPRVWWIFETECLNAVTHNPDLTALATALASIPATVTHCVIDAETTYLGTAAEMTARNADVQTILDTCRAAKPLIKFGMYGFPVQVCSAIPDAVWTTAAAGCTGWLSADFMAPSIYQGAATADIDCTNTKVNQALVSGAVNNRPVLLLCSHRVYTGNYPLIPVAEFINHIAAGFVPRKVNGSIGGADGAIFWDADDDFTTQITAGGEKPASLTMAQWIDEVHHRYRDVLNNTFDNAQFRRGVANRSRPGLRRYKAASRFKS